MIAYNRLQITFAVFISLDHVLTNLFGVGSYCNEIIFFHLTPISLYGYDHAGAFDRKKKKAPEWTFLDVLTLLTEKKNTSTVTSHLSAPFLYTLSSALCKSMPEHCNLWQDSPNWFCHLFLLLLHSR